MLHVKRRRDKVLGESSKKRKAIHADNSEKEGIRDLPESEGEEVDKIDFEEDEEPFDRAAVALVEAQESVDAESEVVEPATEGDVEEEEEEKDATGALAFTEEARMGSSRQRERRTAPAETVVGRETGDEPLHFDLIEEKRACSPGKAR